jgi:hypothetical protein
MARTIGDVTYDTGLAVDGYTVKSSSQLRISTRDIGDTPTLYDIQAAFGTASEVGEGFLGVLNPNGAGTSCYLCACDGTNWFSLPMTLMEA